MKKVFTLIVFVVVVSGCNFNCTDPFVVTNVHCETGLKEDVCVFKCLCFDFFNATTCEVNKIEAVCNIFGESENIQFVNNINVKINFEGKIEPQENISLSCSIDNIYLPENEIPTVENFRIVEIVYEDGSVWKNNYVLLGGKI